MKSKFSTILFICILFLYNIYANEINDVRKKLIETTNHILSIERENIELSNSNMLTQQHEKKELLEIFHHKKVGQILKNLRRAQESSPLLMVLSNHSIDNLIKTAMLIKVLKPQLDKKYSSLLSQFKLISKNRSELESNTKKIEANKERILNLEKKQEELLNIKYRLFFKTSHNPNLEKFAKEHSLSNENNLPSQNFDDLVHQLQTLFTFEKGKSTQKLSILFPANGIINPQHQQDSNVYDLSLKIETTSNAHVISPIDANVVFTGFIPNFGQVIILKQDDFFCVLTGLGLINCFLGDTLSAGEPIGRMPASEDKSETSFKLRLELHKGGQHLDPRPYLAA